MSRPDAGRLPTKTIRLEDYQGITIESHNFDRTVRVSKEIATSGNDRLLALLDFADACERAANAALDLAVDLI